MRDLMEFSRRALLQSAAGAALAACAPAKPPRPGGEDGRLNFYNLDNNIGRTTLADFDAATGIDVNMSLFTDEDDLFAAMMRSDPGFDLIAPTNEIMTALVQAGRLAQIDHAQIPNLSDLGFAFLNPSYDPDLRYSIPYTWRVLGIGYRKSKVIAPPTSWAVLFDSADYAGRIAVPASPRDLVRCCAKYLRQSVNGITDSTLAAIEAMLIKQKPNIKAFHQDNGQDLLLAGEVDLVLEYNEDIARVMRRDNDLAFVVPKEGSVMSARCLSIPAGAARPHSAHRLINYLLDAKVDAAITRTILRPTPNEAARALLDDKLKNNPVLFPPADQLEPCEFAVYEGLERAQAFAALVARVREYAPPAESAAPAGAAGAEVSLNAKSLQ